jgi:hypothetical protein
MWQFALFPKMKLGLKGRRFDDMEIINRSDAATYVSIKNRHPQVVLGIENC